MKINAEGQVTVPHRIRRQLGLLPGTAVEWEMHECAAVLRPASSRAPGEGRALVEHLRGRGGGRLSTDAIMALMRGAA